MEPGNAAIVAATSLPDAAATSLERGVKSGPGASFDKAGLRCTSSHVQAKPSGPEPSLADLDPTGNLQFEIDYRQVYASVLEDWLGVDSTSILGSAWSKVSAFK